MQPIQGLAWPTTHAQIMSTSSTPSRRYLARLVWGADGQVVKEKVLHKNATLTIGTSHAADFVLPEDVCRVATHVLVARGADGFELDVAHAPFAIDRARSRGLERLDGKATTLISLGDLAIEIVPVDDDASLVAAPIALGLLGWGVGSSFLVHGSLLAILAAWMAPLGANDAEGIDREQILQMRAWLDAAAEREQEAIDEPDPGGETGGNDAAEAGERHKGQEGRMGHEKAQGDGHFAIKGDADPKDAELARKEAIEAAREFGMVGLLASVNVDDPNAPSSPWANAAVGSDDTSAFGNFWSTSIGDAYGTGLGLSGTGEGGGGNGLGVGLHDVGGLTRSLHSRRGGTCDSGPCSGFGHGRNRGTHKAKAPTMRFPKDFDTNGRLPAEIIQRVVRQNQGRYRQCYENGLRTNPSLAGRVVVNFVIGRDGSVSVARDGGSELPDASVKSCVVKSFYSLSFPAPSNGTVQVKYPLMLMPDA